MRASASAHASHRGGALRATRRLCVSPARLGLAVLLAGAIAVRAWLIAAYGPAFLGFGDSHEYVTAAAGSVFHDLQKPAGYPIFLAALHTPSGRLALAIVVQHLLGIACGLLLYGAVARTGAPRWAGLLPAAFAFFAGTGLLLEHSLLADSLFAFLQSCAIYLGARALCDSELRFALLAGLASGASFWVKTVGIAGVLILPAVLLLWADGSGARRARVASGAAAAGLALALAYPLAQGATTGYWGYEHQGAWNLYGRVATFVDCSRFSPPAGTRFLCPSEPPSQRQSESYYQYARAAPAVRRFGGPSRAPAYANGILQRFSVAVITHEPLAYASALLRGLTFYVVPRAGEGYTPESLRSALLDPRGVASIQPAITAYYGRTHGYRGSPGALASFERNTRVQGIPLILLLLGALAASVLLRGRQRAAAALFTAMALGPVLLADAGNSYDARYGYPAFAPLAAAAALGWWGVLGRLRAGAAARTGPADGDGA